MNKRPLKREWPFRVSHVPPQDRKATDSPSEPLLGQTLAATQQVGRRTSTGSPRKGSEQA